MRAIVVGCLLLAGCSKPELEATISAHVEGDVIAVEVEPYVGSHKVTIGTQVVTAQPREPGRAYIAIDRYPPGKATIEIHDDTGAATGVDVMVPHGGGQPFFAVDGCAAATSPGALAATFGGGGFRKLTCAAGDDYAVALAATASPGSQLTIEGKPVPVGPDGEVAFRATLERYLDDSSPQEFHIRVEKAGGTPFTGTLRLDVDRHAFTAAALAKFKPGAPLMAGMPTGKLGPVVYWKADKSIVDVGAPVPLHKLRYVAIGKAGASGAGPSCGPYDAGVGMVQSTKSTLEVVVYDLATGGEVNRQTFEPATECPGAVVQTGNTAPSVSFSVHDPQVIAWLQ